MTVIDLTAARQKREPHAHGQMFCMRCDHEWEGVVPFTGGPQQLGLNDNPVECPACKAMCGRMKFDFGPPADQLQWTCACGNQLFYLNPEGITCPRCGTRQVFPAL